MNEKKLKIVERKEPTKLKKLLNWLNKPRFIQFTKNSITWGDCQTHGEFYRKVNFLFMDAYEHFFEIYTKRYAQKIGNSIDFHPEYYASKKAENKALIDILRVVRENRVDDIYNQLKKGA